VARATYVADLAKPGVPPDQEAGVPAGPPSGTAPCPGEAKPPGQCASSAPLHQVSRRWPAPADRYRQAETRQRGSGARRQASSRRARSRRFTGARRLLPTQLRISRHPLRDPEISRSRGCRFGSNDQLTPFALWFLNVC